ncbi:MAG: DNA translocase FtsK, partial [Betaproteobacteria bacterium]|nr:DNA translocase FtsK [Betaproteobacteria bacterium]NCA24403.1 DNA translocase FtsK [Betaproteobacteria bacterium]
MATKPASPSASATPGLPPRLLQLVREALWTLALVAGIYLTLCLVTHDPADPGWSRAAGDAAVINRGGVVGAWVSDILYYVFGGSALWLLLAAGTGLVRTYSM